MKKRFFSIAALVAAMLFAASCSKDDDKENTVTPSNPLPAEQVDAQQTITVPITIAVGYDHQPLSKAKIEDNWNDDKSLDQYFEEGDELYITGDGLAEGVDNPVLTLKELSKDNKKAVFNGEIQIKKGAVAIPKKKLVKYVYEPYYTFTATLRHKDENGQLINHGEKLTEAKTDAQSWMDAFHKYGLLSAEFKYYIGEENEINLTLQQHTVVLDVFVDFKGAFLEVNLPGETDFKPIPLNQSEYTYIALPSGSTVKSQMIENGEPWKINLEEEYEKNGEATVLYTIRRYTPEGCIPALFSVAPGKQVFFAKGNLQYNPKEGLWQLANKQYERCYTVNGVYANHYSTEDKYDGWIDLFGWGTWLKGQSPLQIDNDNTKYSCPENAELACGEKWTLLSGGDQEIIGSEWYYLLKERDDASYKFSEGKIDMGDEGTVNGLIILPDVFSIPDGCNYLSNRTWWTNSYTITTWAHMEDAGAVFLPASGYRNGDEVKKTNEEGTYSSLSASSNIGVWSAHFEQYSYSEAIGYMRSFGYSVRLVQGLENALTQDPNAM